MTAWIRSVATSLIGTPDGTATRGDARPGDLLLAFQSADSGTLSELFLGGFFGAEWLFLTGISGGTWPGSNSGNWAGCIVWSRTCEQGEPTSYETAQGLVADSVVTIVAIADALPGTTQVARRLGNNTPALTPNHAGGLQLRYVTGVPDPEGEPVDWDPAPAGYTQRAAVQSDQTTAAMLVSRPVVSTAPLEQLPLTSDPSLSAAAITVFVASTEPTVPEPPVVQPYAPGAGAATWRYMFFRALDRTYLGDLPLAGVGFDAKLLVPGTFRANIPIPNRRVADQVAEIIPREAVNDPDNYPLDRGPGVIAVQILREGVPQIEYWINGTRLARGRRGGVGIALRGITWDGWMSTVEIEDDLVLAGDQVDIARSVLTHLMAQPNCNISLELAPGSSGVSREVAYLGSEGGRYGQRLQELYEADNGFEAQIRLELVDGVLVRRWVWGAPLGDQSNPPIHTWFDGQSNGDILEYHEEVDVGRGFTRGRARGTSISADASTRGVPLISSAHEATAHLDAGWLRTSRTITYPTQTDQDTLEAYAAYWVAKAGGAVTVDTATVTYGKVVTFSPNNLGDLGRFYLHNAWHRGIWRHRRVIGMGVTPISKDTGKEEVGLVLTGPGVPDA